MKGLHRIIPRALSRPDRKIFLLVSNLESRVLDSTLPRLTRAANRSVLWIIVSVFLGVAGGRKGRRAAIRGLTSLGLTSLLVNLPFKRIWGRKRPDHRLVPKSRRALTLPESTSFPSGHSASAFAYAIGAAQEFPALAAPLGLSATAVAFSRVYVGVHYPLDVVAGAALGSAMGLASRRWLPMAPTEAVEFTHEFHLARRAEILDGEGMVIVVNSDAGSNHSTELFTLFAKELPEAEVVETSGDDITEILVRKAGHAEVVGIVGGDGTVGAAAKYAMQEGKILAVFPGGTLNHFARHLGFEKPEDTVRAIKEGTVSLVDVGKTGEHIFLNTASLGTYPQYVDIREKLQDRWGKWPAMFIGLAKALRESKPSSIEVNNRTYRIWMIFIGNCKFEPSGFAPSWRRRLDDDLLDVRLVSADEKWARLRLIGAFLAGRINKSSIYTELTTSELEISSLDGPLRLACDGESFDGPERVTISKLPTALQVFVLVDKEQSG